MQLPRWLADFTITLNRLIVAVTVFATSFGWFYLVHLVLLEAVFTRFMVTEQDIYAIRMLFCVSTTISAMIGSRLNNKIARRRLLELWIILGVFFTALFAVFQDYTVYLVLDIALGLSFGVGFPASMAQIVEWTVIEERARVFGIALLVTFVYSSVLALTLSYVPLSIMELIVLGVVLRAISMIPVRLHPSEQAPRTRPSWGNVFRTQGFILYLLPWIMFLLANGVLSLIESWLRDIYAFQSVVLMGLGLQYLSVSLSAYLSGVIGDRYGRKRALIPGLILLGVSYALFSFVTSPTTYLFIKLVTGIAWGFIVTNMLTTLGDLAALNRSEQFYAIGGIAPLILSYLFQGLTSILNISIDPGFLSSLLSITLFVSVVPLVYAPETLPIDKMRIRRIREYINKVRDVLDRENTDQDN
jgi:MFS family permease